jgi:hypothetical protein
MFLKLLAAPPGTAATNAKQIIVLFAVAVMFRLFRKEAAGAAGTHVILIVGGGALRIGGKGKTRFRRPRMCKSVRLELNEQFLQLRDGTGVFPGLHYARKTSI